MEKHIDERLVYWKYNIKIMTILLSIWFLVSFIFSIFFVDYLNNITFFGFKMGFWWAQQGSIFTFVILVFVYSFLMNRIDNKFQEKLKA